MVIVEYTHVHGSPGGEVHLACPPQKQQAPGRARSRLLALGWRGLWRRPLPTHPSSSIYPQHTCCTRTANTLRSLVQGQGAPSPFAPPCTHRRPQRPQPSACCGRWRIECPHAPGTASGPRSPCGSTDHGKKECRGMGVAGRNGGASAAPVSEVSELCMGEANKEVSWLVKPPWDHCVATALSPPHTRMHPTTQDPTARKTRTHSLHGSEPAPCW